MAEPRNQLAVYLERSRDGLRRAAMQAPAMLADALPRPVVQAADDLAGYVRPVAEFLPGASIVDSQRYGQQAYRDALNGDLLSAGNNLAQGAGWAALDLLGTGMVARPAARGVNELARMSAPAPAGRSQIPRAGRVNLEDDPLFQAFQEYGLAR